MERTRIRRNFKSRLSGLVWMPLLLIAFFFESELGLDIKDKHFAFMFILAGGASLAYLMFPHSVFDKELITLYRTENSNLKKIIRSDFEKIEFSMTPLDKGFLEEGDKLIIDISTIRFSDIPLIEAEFGASALVNTEVDDVYKNSSWWVLFYSLLTIIPLGFIVLGFTWIVMPLVM